MALVLFSDLPPVRKREVSSIIGHYIAGVLDRSSMVNYVDSLCATAEFKPGDRVKSMRGSSSGVVVEILADSRVVWRVDGTKSELIASSESLLRADVVR